MMKFKILLYYLFVAKFPHSRFWSGFNRIRVWYVSSVLKIMKFDKNSYFENNVYIGNCVNVNIGSHCHINENVFIQGATIGDFVMIAPGVAILNSKHNTINIDLPMILQNQVKGLNPIIEDDVWLGRNAIILPGVIVAKGTVVGAGAVVTKNFGPNSIIAGVPARLIKQRY